MVSFIDTFETSGKGLVTDFKCTTEPSDVPPGEI